MNAVPVKSPKTWTKKSDPLFGTTDNTALAGAFQQGSGSRFIHDWINSSFGQQVDTQINGLFQVPSGFCGMICDGAAGTQADPTGGNGGLLAGDGGTGGGGGTGGTGTVANGTSGTAGATGSPGSAGAPG